jgi:predicted nucleotide-binding protein (sugar kinase/HSP70/actin superfamily)
MKIGIPRGLLFYRYYPLWKTFLEELGAEVVLSHETSKRILNKGLKKASDEVCLPVKVFHGHVEDLIEKVDYLFIPRIISIEPKRYVRYTCPKFMGLPDMIKGTFYNLPPILEPDVNLMEEPIERSYYKLGKQLTRDKKRIKQAYTRAKEKQDLYDKLLLKGKEPAEAIKIIYERESDEGDYVENSKELSIVVVGHPYILFDHYISVDILDKLRSLGASVITSFSLPQKVLDREADKYQEVSWSYEREVIGAVSYYSHTGKADGIIYLISFGCGPGSVVKEILLREVLRDSKVPFLSLVMDEHTGEVGILTRLESFLDMIKMQRGDGKGLEPLKKKAK